MLHKKLIALSLAYFTMFLGTLTAMDAPTATLSGNVVQPKNGSFEAVATDVKKVIISMAISPDSTLNAF